MLLSRWILLYSTHFLRIYKTISSLNKTAKNAKNGKNFIQADSQLLQSDLAPLSPWVPLPPSVHIDGFHYPHWVNSCGSFAFSIYSYLLLWNIFSFISNISSFEQRMARWILSPRPAPLGPLPGVKRTIKSRGFLAIYKRTLSAFIKSIKSSKSIKSRGFLAIYKRTLSAFIKIY